MSSSGELESLWNDAFGAYEKETGRRLGQDTPLRNLKSSDDLLHHIELGGKAFSNWRQKHHKLWSRLSSFLSPVAALGSIARNAVSPWAPVSIVLESILYLVKSCEQVSNAYDWVERVFSELQEFSDRLRQYLKSEMDQMLKRKVTAILAFVLRVIGRSEALVKTNRFREYLRVTFLGKDEKTKALLDDLSGYLKGEKSYVLALTYASSRATEETVGRLETTTRKTNDYVKDIASTVQTLSNATKAHETEDTQAADDALLKRALDELSITKDVEENFSTYRRNLLEGSCGWLQHEPLFDAWLNGEAPVLWVFGGPGVGKSYLSTWTILRLLDVYSQSPKLGSQVSMGYFYIKENKETLRDPNNILKTLAWRLTLADPVFRKHALRLCKSISAIATADDTWENLFLDYYHSSSGGDRSAVLVLDGLDEAGPAARKKLLGFMKALATSTPGLPRPRIQFAVFGRSTLKGDMEMAEGDKYIEISKVKNNDDIERYIQKRLQEVLLLKELRKSKPNGPQRAKKVEKHVKMKVLQGADGVFLWAQLLLDQIVNKDWAQIDKVLSNLPSDLDEMIWSVFNRLASDPDTDHEQVRKMLAWIVYARRPLLFGELDLVLTLPTRTPNFLLWGNLQGRFSSVISLTYPEGISTNHEISITIDCNSAVVSHMNEETSIAKDTNEDEDGDSSEDSASEIDDIIFPQVRNRSKNSGVNDIIQNESELNIFTSGQLKTVVTLTHQRIRDYLIREGYPQRRTLAHLNIYPDIARAQVDIVKSCLDVLHLGSTFADEKVCLMDYPAKHFIWHLDAIEKDLVSENDKCQILNGLCWLFYDEKGIETLIRVAQSSDRRGLDEYWRTWLATDRFSKTIQEWFKGADSLINSLGNQASSWVKAATMSRKELYKPLATTAAKMWLTKTKYYSREYMKSSDFQVCILWAYLEMDDRGIMSKSVRDFSWYKLDFGSLSSTHLQRLAEWAQLEQTTHWYTSFGWILVKAEYYEQAITQFEHALSLDQNAWAAMEGLARSFGRTGSPELAIKLMKRAIDLVPHNLMQIKASLWPWVSSWKTMVGDLNGAFEAAEQGFKADPASPLALLWYLQALDRNGHSEKVIQVIEEADRRWFEPERKISYFVRFWVSGWNACDIVGRACRAMGRPEFVLVAMKRVMTLIDQTSNEMVQIRFPSLLASFCYRYYDQAEESMALWETTLQRLAAKDASFQEGLSETKKTWIDSVCQLYFDAAVEAHKLGTETSQYITKLRKLSVVTKTNSADGTSLEIFDTEYPSVLYGRWLQDYQGAQKASWRKPLQAKLLKLMDTVLYGQETHDADGLYHLAITLLTAGDRTTAGAVLAILFKPLEDRKKVQEAINAMISSGESGPKLPYDARESGESLSVSMNTRARSLSGTASSFHTAQGGDLVKEPAQTLAPATAPRRTRTKSDLRLITALVHHKCDMCGKDALDTEEMYFCEICCNKRYCGEDLRKIRTDSQSELPARECNQAHLWYRAWPIPSDARDKAAEWLGEEAVLRRKWVGREVLLRKEWLEALRREWMAG